MFSKYAIDFRSNEKKQISFTIDTNHLTPSKYSVDIIAYYTDCLGEDHFIDGVYPAFIFEISDRINDRNSKVWYQKYWGAIHLQDVDIKEIKI